jgi:hypothetical protein
MVRSEKRQAHDQDGHATAGAKGRSAFATLGCVTDGKRTGKSACATGVPALPEGCKKEGKSHDVVDNKGWDFLSHDVHDK